MNKYRVLTRTLKTEVKMRSFMKCSILHIFTIGAFQKLELKTHNLSFYKGLSQISCVLEG